MYRGKIYNLFLEGYLLGWYLSLSLWLERGVRNGYARDKLWCRVKLVKSLVVYCNKMRIYPPS